MSIKKATASRSAEDAVYSALIDEFSVGSESERSLAADLKRMTYVDLKSALEYSVRLNRLATPTGSTPLYLQLSKVKANGQDGVVNRRERYYTRDLEHAESGKTENTLKLSSKGDYLEGQGRFKRAKQDDVQFIETNMGRSRIERRKTAELIEAAEKSVKEGGKRRSKVDSAVVMDSIIMSLPAELTNNGRRSIAEKLGVFFAEARVFYLAVGHRPSELGDQRNHHLHLIFSRRPFSRDADGQFMFSDCVNRDLQGPRFLKKLRAVATEACNTALKAEGIERRIFAGTYAENGLPIAQSRTRASIKKYHNDRKSKNAAIEVQEVNQPQLITLMRDIVSAVEKRLERDRILRATEQKVKAAKDQRARFIDASMLRLLDAGTLLAVDKGTKKIHLGIQHSDDLVRFVPAQHAVGLQLLTPGEPRGLRSLLTRMGDHLHDWVNQNGPLLMKSWSSKPELALSAIRRHSGQLSITKSGAISVQPADGTWNGKGLLSWLADAVRNHGAGEIIKHLTGVDVSKTERRSIPLANKTFSDFETYVAALHTNQDIDAKLLASVRGHVAARQKIVLSVDQIPNLDAALEESLHSYASAAYLVQQHRKLIASNLALSADAQGLTQEAALYQTALTKLEKVAPAAREVREAIRETIVAASRYFGRTLWRGKLGGDLTNLLSGLGGPAGVVVEHLSTMHVELPSGEIINRGDLKTWAEATLKASRTANRRSHSISSELSDQRQL